MKKAIIVLALFLILIYPAFALTEFKLINSTGQAMNLSYDLNSTSYKDNSITNPRAWVKVCGSDLLNKWVGLVYSGGNNSAFKIVSNLAKFITSLDASNCITFPADISSFRALYPSRIACSVSSSPDLSNGNIYFSDEYMIGKYRVQQTDNGTHVEVRVKNIIDDQGNEITVNQSFLVVTLIRKDTKEVLDSAVTYKNVSVTLSRSGYNGDVEILINGMKPVYIAISLSPTLASGITYGTLDPGDVNVSSQNCINKACNITVSQDTNVNVDIVMKVNAYLTHQSGSTIETQYWNSSLTQQPTLPAYQVSLTYDYTHKVAENVSPGTDVIFGTWVSIPTDAATGLYNNTIYFCAQEAGLNEC